MPVRHCPVHLAAAMAAFAQDRYCGRLGTGIAIPPVLPLLVGQRLFAGNASQRHHSVQLGLRRYRVAGIASINAGFGAGGRDAGAATPA